jgi:hypothetical protein
MSLVWMDILLPNPVPFPSTVNQDHTPPGLEIEPTHKRYKVPGNRSERSICHLYIVRLCSSPGPENRKWGSRATRQLTHFTAEGQRDMTFDLFQLFWIFSFVIHHPLVRSSRVVRMKLAAGGLSSRQEATRSTTCAEGSAETYV